MPVDTTWTDPSEGGAADVELDEVLQPTVWDLILSNLKRLGGTDGNTKTGGYVIGGLLDLSGASAGQIKFPASQNASADANTLDDYEEGTWTIALTASASGTIIADSGEDLGAYTKIGDVVHCWGYVSIASVSSPVGDLRISLPFTAATLGEIAGRPTGAVATQGVDIDASCVGLTLTTANGLAYATIYQTIDNGNLTTVQCSQIAGTDIIKFSLTYKPA